MSERNMRKGWEAGIGRGTSASRFILGGGLEYALELVAAPSPAADWLWAVRDSDGAIVKNGIAITEPAAQLAAEQALRGILTAALVELES